MFDSGITSGQIIAQLQDEIDVAYPISVRTMVFWINTVEQLVYSEIIKEQGSLFINDPLAETIRLDQIHAGTSRDKIRFTDILMVYADGQELTKTTVNSQRFFENTYYFDNGMLKINVDPAPSKLEIIYIIRPKLKTAESIAQDRIMLPLEFLELVMSRVRAEAYKAANEDSIAAKWMNDYNILLENFKTWMAQKQPAFGI